MYRKTYVEIDCEALENNIKEIREKYNGYKYYIGVVKANCYSHGIESIKYLIKGGINYLATSSLEEALQIRNTYKKIPILVMEPIHYEDILIASEKNITITIDNIEQFKKIIKNKNNIKFHIKIDSGMNRFGLKNKEDVKYIVNKSNNKVQLEGIFTHLSVGFGKEFDREVSNFKDLTSLINLESIPIVHIERSLTLEQHERLPIGNSIRLGILMYGFNKQAYIPSWKRRLFNKLTLKNNTDEPSILNVSTAFKFYSEIIEIKEVLPGEIIGYNGMYDVKEKMRIAILPFGFADYLYVNKSYISINNKLYKILTNYMDITVIEVDENVKVGNKVEIFGNNISIRKASTWANQNVYKTLCSITYRVPRIYKYNNKEIED